MLFLYFLPESMHRLPTIYRVQWLKTMRIPLKAGLFFAKSIQL